jgi:DNA-binding NarL/FixJ family response regulator
MRVLIADDQRVVREGLATIVDAFPGVEVVGLAGDGAEAVALAAEHAPDVVLMDLRMPRLDGVEATRTIREHDPSIAVVVLTTFADDDSVIAALSAGAAGYLTKDAARDDIRRALEAAVAGQSVLDPSGAGSPAQSGPAGFGAPVGASRRPHPPRGRGFGPHRGRTFERPDRRTPLRRRSNGEDPCQPDLRQNPKP